MKNYLPKEAKAKQKYLSEKSELLQALHSKGFMAYSPKEELLISHGNLLKKRKTWQLQYLVAAFVVRKLGGVITIHIFGF